MASPSSTTRDLSEGLASSSRASSSQPADETTTLASLVKDIEREERIDDAPRRDILDLIVPPEIAEGIVEPEALLRASCHGHRRADNRGLLLDEYCELVGEIVQQYGSNTDLALAIFHRNHTLRLEAEELRHLEQSSLPSTLPPLSSNGLDLPFDQVELHHLTIFSHGGSLSSCDEDISRLLRESLPKTTSYFPSLEVLKIEITWEINEEQEAHGPIYIYRFNRGQIDADLLPLIDIPGAHQTCHEFFLLAWQLHEFCVENDCEIEAFSMDRFAAFNGKWGHDLEAAGYLFPNSNAWNPNGFQTWMSEYTVTHYEVSDVDSEGEPIAVEYVGRAADLGPAESDGRR